MIKLGFIIDAMKYRIIRDCSYNDTRVDDLYYKVDDKDLIPIAYIFPIENKPQILELLAKLENAKRDFDAIVSQVYYKEFPKYR